ncbi:hypothetical protein VTJ04DRAFT_3996 [Mycothermus thermophilus]|uniref:uncharacterized protein n=1 Tax=Humicola insolens TaxID=85995 RepID=UPI003743B2E9
MSPFESYLLHVSATHPDVASHPSPRTTQATDTIQKRRQRTFNNPIPPLLHSPALTNNGPFPSIARGISGVSSPSFLTFASHIMNATSQTSRAGKWLSGVAFGYSGHDSSRIHPLGSENIKQ